MKAIELWKCGECHEVHDDEDGALECCKPHVFEVYGCPVCKEVHDGEEQAIKCCAEVHGGVTRCPCCARDYTVAEINHFAIEVAGHCNTCMPMFTVDEQLQIEDMHLRENPYSDQSLLR